MQNAAFGAKSTVLPLGWGRGAKKWGFLPQSLLWCGVAAMRIARNGPWHGATSMGGLRVYGVPFFTLPEGHLGPFRARGASFMLVTRRVPGNLIRLREIRSSRLSTFRVARKSSHFNHLFTVKMYPLGYTLHPFLGPFPILLTPCVVPYRVYIAPIPSPSITLLAPLIAPYRVHFLSCWYSALYPHRVYSAPFPSPDIIFLAPSLVPYRVYFAPFPSPDIIFSAPCCGTPAAADRARLDASWTISPGRISLSVAIYCR